MMSLNDRISSQEGTAKDLLALPVVGRIIIFARGCQRPMWGYAVLYIDYKILSGSWLIPDGTSEQLVLIINYLVLGFLFGERAVRNIGPIIQKMVIKK